MGKRQGLCVGQAQCALSLQRGAAVAHAGHEFHHRGQVLSDFRLPDCHCGPGLAGHPAGHADRTLLIPCRHRKNADHCAPRHRKGRPGGLCWFKADLYTFGQQDLRQHAALRFLHLRHGHGEVCPAAYPRRPGGGRLHSHRRFVWRRHDMENRGRGDLFRRAQGL